MQFHVPSNHSNQHDDHSPPGNIDPLAVTLPHFNIRTRYSPDNGATFQPIVIASNETTMFELPFWLGPFARYHRWWGGMFPSLAIAPNGSAHIG